MSACTTWSRRRQGRRLIIVSDIAVLGTESRLSPLFTWFFIWMPLLLLFSTRRVFVRNRIPMICLCNVLCSICTTYILITGLRYGATLVSLVLYIVRYPWKTYKHTYIHAWPEPVFHRLLDSAFGTQPPAELYIHDIYMYMPTHRIHRVLPAKLPRRQTNEHGGNFNQLFVKVE